MSPGKIPTIIILCLLTSCIDNIRKEHPKSNCSTALASPLKLSNVKSLLESANSQKINGIADSDKPVGFVFSAKAGQLINYTSSGDVCIILFSPENKPMTPGEIDADGKYLIQVSVPEGSRTFTLNVEVNNKPEPVKAESSVYAKLEIFLKNKDFRSADQETTRLLLIFADREEQQSINSASVENLKCHDLSIIDQLWSQNSDHKFGLLIQNKIWKDSGRDSVSFTRKIGWLDSRGVRSYDQLEFSSSAPIGHLPIGDYGPIMLKGLAKINNAIESRLDACNLK
jgi:septum formation topological specificity factor MinE